MDAKAILLSSRGREAVLTSSAGLVWLIILLALSLAVSGCSRPAPGSAKTSDEVLAQLHDDRTEIDQMSQTMMKRIDMFNESRKAGEPTLQFSEIFMQDLNPEQRDVLDSMMQQEKDLSFKNLLQQIITDRNSIRELQEKVMHLEQTLPDKFVVAKRGDTHQDLAMAYLTGEAHVDEVKAKDLLKHSDQTDELVAGNQVWFFYDPQKDTFRTYVTMGDAGQTPVMVRRARTKQLIKERDAFMQERDTANEHVATLQQDKSQLETDKSQLQDTLFVQQNSLYFHAASDQELKYQGVLSSVLKRVRDVQTVNYDQSVNLAEETTISLNPGTYGLTEIRSVRVLPEIYQEGRDFAIEIEPDYTSARVRILDPALFKGKEILLALRS
jgi:hypothetical protein